MDVELQNLLMGIAIVIMIAVSVTLLLKWESVNMKENIEIQSNETMKLGFKFSLMLWITTISINVATWKYILFG